VLAAHFSRLQGTVYLLLARAEVDDQGVLVMPVALAEPRLALPQSGLYASIYNPVRNEEWRSASALGGAPPFRREGVQVGEWLTEIVSAGGKSWHAMTYAVNWAAASREVPLVLS